jgi:hypothetical protein
MILSPALESPLANLISEAPRRFLGVTKRLPPPKKEVPGAKLRIGLRPNRANRLGPLFENVPPRSASPRLDRPLAAAIARLRCGYATGSNFLRLRLRLSSIRRIIQIRGHSCANPRPSRRLGCCQLCRIAFTRRRSSARIMSGRDGPCLTNPHHDLPAAGAEFPCASRAMGEQLCAQNFWQ